MSRTHEKRTWPMAALAVLAFAAAAPAATVTNVFTELFDDATLEAGLTNVNATPIAGGIADLNGSDANNTAQGFTFSNTAYNNNGTNWIMEADLDVATTTGGLDVFLNFNGHLYLRGPQPSVTLGKGANTGSADTVVAAQPANGNHVAIVFTENGTSDTLAYYHNGTLFNTLTINSTFSQATTMGFGLEVHAGAPLSRGFNGSLDAIAFSTFTGTLNPATDFALFTPPPPVPLVLTNIFTERFDDATLEPGLTNHNATPIAGGLADPNGSNANNTAQGFTFDNSPYNTTVLPAQSGGPTTNWIMEAILGQASTATLNDALFAFNGHIGVRRTNAAANWEMFASGIGSFLFAAPTDGQHIGFVFIDNGTSDLLRLYIDGVLVGQLTGNAALSAASIMGFGLETHLGAPLSRGFDGSLDAIAFSTFTGDFTGGQQFALLAPVAVVPAPAAMPAGLALLGLAAARRRRHR